MPPTPNRFANVRVPVRVKITFPYAVLALFLALGAAYIVSRVVLDTVEERFTDHLIEVGKISSDWMVREENRLLQTLRLLSNTQGMADAISARDAEQLRRLALPIAANNAEEAVEIIGLDGETLLSLRHQRGGNLEEYGAARGDTTLATAESVQQILRGQTDRLGDKYAELVSAPWGTHLYVVGPVTDNTGQLVGVILVGKTPHTIVRQMRQDTLAHTTIYDFEGQPVVSTLHLDNVPPLPSDHILELLAHQSQESMTRDMTVGSVNYSEIVGPWQARSSNDLGLIGATLPHAFLVRPKAITRLQIFLLVTLAFLLVIGTGVYLANRITRPLMRVVDASAKVAQGELDVQVEATGNDEVALLAQSFNVMVSGLKEGAVYRDLLGRTVSPQVRDQLRECFATGDLRLEGQNTVATVLLSDIRGFTQISEHADPTTILSWLNGYFGQVVPIIASRGGVVNKLDGDSVLAFFGILPCPVEPKESAYSACTAALQMLHAIQQVNAERAQRDAPPFVTGIGIHTGVVTAGGLGSEDRLHYTIIGDTVNTTQRIEDLTHEMSGNHALISQATLDALGDQRDEFSIEPLGAHTLRGKSERLLVYRLLP